MSLCSPSSEPEAGGLFFHVQNDFGVNLASNFENSGVMGKPYWKKLAVSNISDNWFGERSVTPTTSET